MPSAENISWRARLADVDKNTPPGSELFAGSGILARGHDRRGCKLDPKLISALVERWRPGTHTFIFHVESVLSLWKTCICNWDCRWMGTQSPSPHHLLIEELYAMSFWVLYRIILTEVGSRWTDDWRLSDAGLVMKPRTSEMAEVAYHYCNHGHGFAFHFTSLNRPPIYISTHKEVEPFDELCRIPTSLEYILLVLDQRSEAQTPNEDPAIRAVILDEFLQNPNAWHVKVALVNYATVEMHQSDRVLRQFGFRQPIPVAPECLMMSTKSTYGNRILIGRDTGHTISKCEKIGMIIYLLGNRSSFQS
ncbi:hypothetical protein CXB51_034638 [Gossypium anomalum]|uniref:Aminotransferase-like plant mobile domain-containing protein n=1 Tax=Gossypium anomalum TaxID=47600 RepID=A0A8J5XN86_9ROSI|nr:hypothetical protein CXB51_034638 [Gossypium anomalum]